MTSNIIQCTSHTDARNTARMWRKLGATAMARWQASLGWHVVVC